MPTHGFSVLPNDPINAFLEDRKSRGLSVATIKFYKDYLERLQKGIKSPLLVTTKSQIQGFIRNLDCSPGGKHAYLRAARTFFNWALEEKYIGENPCKYISVKVPNPDRYTLTIERLELLLSACETELQKGVVSVLADTGLRRSELASIQQGHVDLDNRTIRVLGKGRKRRVVRFGESTASLLGGAIQPRASEEPLFGLSAAGVSSLLVALGRKTGIRCNAHSFRRLFACEAIRNGMNLFHVQSLLGHSTLEMTRLYAHEVGSEDALTQYVPTIR